MFLMMVVGSNENEGKIVTIQPVKPVSIKQILLRNLGSQLEKT